MFSHPHSQVTVTTVQEVPGCLRRQQIGVIYAGFSGINMHVLWDPGDFLLGFKERPGKHNSHCDKTKDAVEFLGCWCEETEMGVC